MEPLKDAKSGAAAIGGALLIVVGLGIFLRTSGIVDAQLLSYISDALGAIVLIALGALLIYYSREGKLKLPPAGTKLYRSREDKWIGGVLGGLGKYLNIDPVVLRIVTLVLTAVGVGSLVLAYIVMWVIVPEEPFVATGPFGAPAPPAPPVPPAPPAGV